MIVPPRIPAVVDRYISAVNDEDWATVAELFTDDAELLAQGAPVARGSLAIAAHLQRVMGGLGAHHDEPTRVVTGGSLAVVEMVVTGRAADDRPVRFTAVDVAELSPDASRIARLATWHDPAAVHAG